MRLVFEALLLPPADLLILALAGLVIMKFKPRFGLALILCALLMLYALSLPFTGALLLKSVSVPNRISGDAQAIVVLSAGLRDRAHEYDGPAPDALTLERLRYAAYLERKTHLPVLVSGGRILGGYVDVAHVMADTLREDYGVVPRWIEDRSVTTAENAQFSAGILRTNGVKRIYLVTHSWHMARARLAFERMGIEVYPAGTVAPYFRKRDIFNLVPDMASLNKSYFGLHELFGYFWYFLTLEPQKGTS